MLRSTHKITSIYLIGEFFLELGRRNVGACLLFAAAVCTCGASSPDPAIMDQRYFGLAYPDTHATVACLGLVALPINCFCAWILLLGQQKQFLFLSWHSVFPQSFKVRHV